MIDWTWLGLTLAVLIVGIWYACSSGGGSEEDSVPPAAQRPGGERPPNQVGRPAAPRAQHDERRSS